MKMRDLINIIEGEVVPFNRPTKADPEPTWTDHGDGIQTKPFAMQDLVSDDAPAMPEAIDLQWSNDYTHRVVYVRWYNWARSFSIHEINRMLKLAPGEEFEALDKDRRNSADFPPHIWKAKRDKSTFVLRFSSHYVGRDKDGKSVHDTTLNALEFAIPVTDLIAAFQNLKTKLAQPTKPTK